jgi:hypothetical protein
MKSNRKTKKAMFWTIVSVAILAVAVFQIWQRYFGKKNASQNEPTTPAVTAATTTESPTTTPVTTPIAPNQTTGVTATVNGNGITINWNANTTGQPPTGYRVEKSTDNGVTWSVFYTAAANATSVANSTLANGTYKYRVVALNGTVAATPSTVVAATVNVSNSTDYALNAISAALKSGSTTRFEITASESNRPTTVNYQFKIKTLAGVVVRDLNETIPLTVSQKVEFTPNDPNIAANQRVTVPGEYVLELTGNGIVRTQNFTFTNSHLGITVNADSNGFVNREGWNPPASSPWRLSLYGEETDFLRIASVTELDDTSTARAGETNPKIYKVVLGNNETNWTDSAWWANGVMLDSSKTFYVLPEDRGKTQITRRSTMNDTLDNWWKVDQRNGSINYKEEQLMLQILLHNEY